PVVAFEFLTGTGYSFKRCNRCQGIGHVAKNCPSKKKPIIIEKQVRKKGVTRNADEDLNVKLDRRVRLSSAAAKEAVKFDSLKQSERL
ncbi:MAG: hypothetical protein EZS28_045235, partial [Streblomastix strix]